MSTSVKCRRCRITRVARYSLPSENLGYNVTNQAQVDASTSQSISELRIFYIESMSKYEGSTQQLRYSHCFKDEYINIKLSK